MGPLGAVTTSGDFARPDPVGPFYGKVALTVHNPAWAEAFSVLAEQLRDRLGELARGIAHIGSTAVRGLSAKAIIDIAIGVDAYRAGEVVAALEGTAWLFRGDKGEQSGGLLFVLESGPQVRIAHAVPYQGAAWLDYLGFRDLLRADPVARQQYQHLKEQLAARFCHDRAAYTAGKQALVRQLLGR